MFYSLNLNSQQVTVLWLRDYDPLHAYRCWESFSELKIRRELCCCHSTHSTDGAAVPHTYVSSLWQFSSPTWLYSFSGEKKKQEPTSLKGSLNKICLFIYAFFQVSILGFYRWLNRNSQIACAHSQWSYLPASAWSRWLSQLDWGFLAGWTIREYYFFFKHHSKSHLTINLLYRFNTNGIIFWNTK